MSVYSKNVRYRDENSDGNVVGYIYGQSKGRGKRLGVWQGRWPRGAISRAIRPQINFPILGLHFRFSSML